MRLLADVHISPRTVAFLNSLGHDCLRVSDVMPENSSDKEIVRFAKSQDRIILTQDLDFSNIIALSGASSPSLITLRLFSSRIEYVNKRLFETLLKVENILLQGAIVTIDTNTVRVRLLPIDTP